MPKLNIRKPSQQTVAAGVFWTAIVAVPATHVTIAVLQYRDSKQNNSED